MNDYDLKAVISTNIFEAGEGLIKPTEACENVLDYIDRNYIKVDELSLKRLERVPAEHIAMAARIFGLCFPVSDGKINVRRDWID